jgi:hypothetical protein
VSNLGSETTRRKIAERRHYHSSVRKVSRSNTLHELRATRSQRRKITSPSHNSSQSVLEEQIPIQTGNELALESTISKPNDFITTSYDENEKTAPLSAEETDVHSNVAKSGGASLKGSRSIALRMLRNVWFWGSVGVAAVGAASIALFVYSFVFLVSFANYGEAASYFPWSWNVVYTSIIPAANLFLSGFLISVLTLGIAAMVSLRFFVPAFKNSYYKA